MGTDWIDMPQAEGAIVPRSFDFSVGLREVWGVSSPLPFFSDGHDPHDVRRG